MDYEIYHDESQENGYWHGVLLIPKEKREVAFKHLDSVRKSLKFYEPLSLKKIKQKNSKYYILAQAWLQIGIGFLIQDFKGKTYQIYTETNRTDRYGLFGDLIGAKFILFREKDRHSKMSQHPDHASKIETTFRMGVKGGLHYLGSPEKPITITKMHFDGHEHYTRNLSKDRIIGRLTGLREYVSIHNDISIDDASSNHKKEKCQDYIDCQFLQLTDIFVGCFRAILSNGSEIHVNLAKPVKDLLLKHKDGYARMKNSRWFSSIACSQCYLDTTKDLWVFEDLEIIKPKVNQQALF